MFGGFSPMPLRLGGSDPEGWVATQHARVSADAAACARSGAWAWITFTIVAGDPSFPRILSYNGMSGNGIGFAPLLTMISDSAVNVVWSPTHDDAYERPEPLAIRHAKATVHGTTLSYATCHWQSGESAVVVQCYDNTGAAAWAANAITLRVT